MRPSDAVDNKMVIPEEVSKDSRSADGGISEGEAMTNAKKMCEWKQERKRRGHDAAEDGVERETTARTPRGK